MITEYKPIAFNDHIVRVTFNKGGAIGHISIKYGGNCRGLDILNNVTDFIETCDEDDIVNLVENDCEFAYNADEDTFNVALNDKNGRTILPSATEDIIKELIVAIEITDYTPFPNYNARKRK